jgi:hypothetical protein
MIDQGFLVRGFAEESGFGSLTRGFLTSHAQAASRSTVARPAHDIQLGDTRSGPGSRCHTRISRDNLPPLPPYIVTDPGDRSHYAAGFPAAALDRSLTHRAGLNVRSPMRRHRVEIAATRRRQEFRQLSVNSPSTLRQGFRAGRPTSITDAFDRSAMPPKALQCKGCRSAGNSASTLRQLFKG